MRDFTPPPTDTKDQLGEVGLEYVFQVELELDDRHESSASKGDRIYRGILGGRVRGPKLTGGVYTQGHGDYGLVRADGVIELNTHIVINVDDEWIYVRHHGYERPDGSARVAAYVDADLRGKHADLNNAVFIAVGESSEDRRTVRYTYFEAV